MKNNNKTITTAYLVALLERFKNTIKKKNILFTYLLFTIFVSTTHFLESEIIANKGDEFENSTSINNWSRIYDIEGWVANQLEDWSINANSSGEMLLMPYSSSWFQDLRGVLAFKEVTGDFVVTAHLRVNSRHNALDPTETPNRSFTLAGIMVRNSTGVTHGAPIPYPNPNVSLPIGSGNSDWSPDLEDYIFLSFGSAGNAGQRAYEVKSTTSGSSSLYYRNRGIPTIIGAEEIWLQFVRVGQTIVVLRRHPGGDWIVENRYDRPDFDDTLQVGITTYTDWNRISSFNNPTGSFHHNYTVIDDGASQPDLIARVDYFRFQRPDTLLTETILQGLTVDETANGVSTALIPLALLTGTAAAPFLGENANINFDILDSDNDGLTNAEENTAGTDIFDPDTDGDGILDGIDNLPTVSSNECINPDTIFSNHTISNGQTQTCATNNSISVESTIVIESGGKLELFSPTVLFSTGFTIPHGGMMIVKSIPLATSP